MPGNEHTPNPPGGAEYAELVATLRRDIGDRYKSLGDGEVVTLAADLPMATWREPDPVCHPVCAGSGSERYCSRRWRALRESLPAQRRAAVHRCPFGKFCGVVPVMAGRRCVAVCWLVRARAVGEAAFDRSMQILGLLVEVYECRHATLLGALAGSGDPSDDRPRDTLHPTVLKAIEHINAHLSDPDLTVRRVALAVGANASYLAHLFVEQMGARMGRYIATRRVGLARELLETTDWPIKRVAAESGHASANWFSHVFRESAGMTPTAYRRSLARA